MNSRHRRILLPALIWLIAMLLMTVLPVMGQDGTMTEVGTPRTETLIVDQLDGRLDNPFQMNPYQAGTSFSAGLHQLVFTNMWEIDTVKGEQFPALAAEMPEPLNDDFTEFRITLREGLYWSDGVELTINDVAYTIDVVLGTPEFPYSGFLSGVIDSYEIVDNYTMILKTKRPEPRLSETLGVTVWGDSFRVVPKHVWENEDPTTYDNYPPVSSGPYVVRDVDPNGSWFLYEKRDDWERTDVGMLVGEPGPQYILFRFYGTEERRIIAGIQHNLDIFTDITPESWDVLREQNEYVQTWYSSFPWANLDDACERGITFVNVNPPYDNVNVRWALALATDMDSVTQSTAAGALRVSPLPVPPIAVLQDAYHKQLRDWLIDFELEDGYKPFDGDYATRIAETLRSQGIEGIPTDEAELIDLFGIGWWRYDPDKATNMLETEGFSQDSGGNWLLPDGSPWQMSIIAPANFEVPSSRLAFSVADVWRRFGIDASVEQVEAGTFWSTFSNGTYEVGSYWPGCGVYPDIYSNMQGWHQQYIVPVGEPAPGNANRHASDAISNILDEIAPLPSNDPRTYELETEFMKIFMAEMPWLPMIGSAKLVPVDTYYWEGYPAADNMYEGPWWWWSLFKYMTPHFQPTGRS